MCKRKKKFINTSNETDADIGSAGKRVAQNKMDAEQNPD